MINNINKIVDGHIKKNLYPGVEWKVNYKEKIFQGKLGYLDINTNQPIVDNTIYRIWSMTKPIISIVALQLIEEKKLKLSDPITDYLPQFQNLKVLKSRESSIENQVDIQKMPTIKDLLSHTAGFTYNFLGDAVGIEYDRLKLFHSEFTTLEEEINLLSTIPLLCQPSTEWVYSVSVDVIGRIIEIVTKNNLQKELKKRIFDPLEMNNTAFTVNQNNQDRIMTSYEFNAVQNKIVEPIVGKQKIGGIGYPTNQLTYARGGHGLFSTLGDFSKFSQMLLNGKTKNGDTIISSEILLKATTNHLKKNYFPLEIKNIAENLEENDLAPYGWGLGFRVMMDLNKADGVGSMGEFGWAGAAATYFLVDPANDLTAVLMTQVLGANPILKNDFIREIYRNL